MFQTNTDKLKLLMSCTQLRTNSSIRIDPLIRVYVQDKANWALLGETELQQDCAEPKFGIPVPVDFNFGVQQNILLEVLNFSGGAPELIGIARTTLGRIVSAEKQFLVEDIKDKSGNDAGAVIIQRQKDGKSKRCVSWKWSGVKLMNTDGFFDKSDPYLRFYREKPNGDFEQVYETEVIPSSLNPVWKPFDILASELCDADNRTIKIECWDWEKKKAHQFIGDCETTLEKILNGQTEIELRHPRKKKSTGTLKILSVTAKDDLSLVDYIIPGQPLKLFIGMNFSQSNRLFPIHPNSSHVLNRDNSFNEYQSAMFGISQIMLDYDHDQTVPMYGFGGIPKFPMIKSGNISHCFPCTGNPSQPRARGIEGIMSTYANAIQNVDLGGTTNLAPLLKEVMQFSQMQKQIAKGAYTVLLVLTNSDIQDLQQAINSIVEASQLPLSIIFVGIGDDAFVNMEKLNGGKNLKSAAGKRAERELAHFVAFRNFKGDMLQFTQYVLDKVPDQFLEYAKLISKKPSAVLKADLSSIEKVQKPHRQTWGPMHNNDNSLFGTDKRMGLQQEGRGLSMTIPIRSNTSNTSMSDYLNNTQNSETEINLQGVSILSNSGGVKSGILSKSGSSINSEKESQTLHRYSLEPFPDYVPGQAQFARTPLSEVSGNMSSFGNSSISTQNQSYHPQIYPTF